MTETQESRLGVARLCTLIFGVLVLSIGLFSYYESKTARKYPLRLDPYNKYYVKIDKYCRMRLDNKYPDRPGLSCPNISLELYYISAVIISFIISWLGCIGSSLTDFKKFKFIELGCYILAAVLLLIGGIVYIVFAGQVSSFATIIGNIGNDDTPIDLWNYYKLGEKRLAGALAIIQALQFGYVAAMVGMQ